MGMGMGKTGIDPELDQRLRLVERAAARDPLNVHDIVAAAIVAGLVPLVLLVIAWLA